MTKNSPDVVIVGAWFAGLSTYLMLKKRIPSLSVLLIDQRDHFTYIPALHNCIGNTRYLKSIQFNYATYYGADFLLDEVTHIDKHLIICASGISFTPKYIVIATGSRTTTYGNASFQQYGQMLRFGEDVKACNKRIESADSISVVGWWYTGVEIICTLAQKFPHKQLRIIHSADRLLHTYHQIVADTVHQWLQQRGVELVLWTRVQELTHDSIILEDSVSVTSDLTILSGGIAINDGPYRDQIKFESGHTSLASEYVYICGDVASHGLLPTAHNAMIEGRRIGDIIADHIQWLTNYYKPIQNRNTLALAMGTRDGMITTIESGFYLPRLTWLSKRIIEQRVLFEFKHKVMLWV